MLQSITRWLCAFALCAGSWARSTHAQEWSSGAPTTDALKAVTHAKPGSNRAVPWLHEGLCLTYTGKHATVQGAQFKIIPGGKIVDQNGNTWTPVRRETAMAGIVLDNDTIAALDGEKIVVATRSFVYDPQAMNKPPRPVGRTGGVSTLADRKVNARFVDPAILQQYLTVPAAGITATRGPFKIGDETLDAISIVYQNGNSYTLNVYDLQTGLQLRFTNTTVDAPPGVVLGGDNARGDTHIHIIDLVYARDLQVPGANKPAPDPIARSSAFRISSSQKMLQLPNAQPARTQTIYSVTARGPNWIAVESRNPNTGGTDKLVWGSAQFMGWWMDPAALATMQRGQVLDEDPVTRSKVVVSYVDGQSVVIADTTADVELDARYDKATGAVIGSRVVGGYPPVESVQQIVGGQ